MNTTNQMEVDPLVDWARNESVRNCHDGRQYGQGNVVYLWKLYLVKHDHVGKRRLTNIEVDELIDQLDRDIDAHATGRKLHTPLKQGLFPGDKKQS